MYKSGACQGYAVTFILVINFSMVHLQRTCKDFPLGIESWIGKRKFDFEITQRKQF